MLLGCKTFSGLSKKLTLGKFITRFCNFCSETAVDLDPVCFGIEFFVVVVGFQALNQANRRTFLLPHQPLALNKLIQVVLCQTRR